jgi:Ca-activated chloride channel family protein
MFELAMPWALLLIPLPWLFWYGMPEVKSGLSLALKVPFFSAASEIMQEEKGPMLTSSGLLMPFFIWLLLVLALAGPRWLGEARPLMREGHQIMMILDLSGSMEINDMVWHGQPVSRLRIVKQAAEQFVQKRVGDKIGLILFGSRAYLQTPLTYDRHHVFMRIEDATAGLAGQTTAIGDALGLAVKRLEAGPKKEPVIILLTDGANNSGVLDPLKAAELAKEAGIKLYTIGLGSDTSLSANYPFISNASADLDEESLEKMAKMTKGRYFRATDTETLHQIYKTIDQLETTKEKQESLRPQKEYYPWLVALALILYLSWMLKWRGIYR